MRTAGAKTTKAPRPPTTMIPAPTASTTRTTIGDRAFEFHRGVNATVNRRWRGQDGDALGCTPYDTPARLPVGKPHYHSATHRSRAVTEARGSAWAKLIGDIIPLAIDVALSRRYRSLPSSCSRAKLIGEGDRRVEARERDRTRLVDGRCRAAPRSTCWRSRRARSATSTAPTASSSRRRCSTRARASGWRTSCSRRTSGS